MLFLFCFVPSLDGSAPNKKRHCCNWCKILPTNTIVGLRLCPGQEDKEEEEEEKESGGGALVSHRPQAGKVLADGSPSPWT